MTYEYDPKTLSDFGFYVVPQMKTFFVGDKMKLVCQVFNSWAKVSDKKNTIAYITISHSDSSQK